MYICPASGVCKCALHKPVVCLHVYDSTSALAWWSQAGGPVMQAWAALVIILP